MTDAEEPRFRPNWLTWTVDRRDRTFRAYVVEPRENSPRNHSEIFFAAVAPFLPAPTQSEYTQPRFDLLTFPEAFLPSETLLEFLRALGTSGVALGCVHSGLRPDMDNDETHLFSTAKLSSLVEGLKQIRRLCAADLEPFTTWLSGQDPDHMFNIGCLFTIDVEQQIRVCLHPKLVRAQYEERPYHDRTMQEANLLSLVTLNPRNPDLHQVTIQPLICSDALDLKTDEQNNHPIPAMTSHRRCFPARLPDHIDIVSVAACTPTGKMSGELPKFIWKQKFREAFVRAAGDDHCHRHHFAIFVLSNFLIFPTGSLVRPEPGGLSGVFVPLPLYRNPYEYPAVSKHMSLYGHFDDEDGSLDENRWTLANEAKLKAAAKTGLGYIVALDPSKSDANALASMFGFIITHIPRDASRWERTGGIRDISIHDALRSSEDGETRLQFKKRDKA